MIASEKATLSLICSVMGGVLNMALDYAFLSLFHLGIGGAAIATGLGYSVTAVVGLAGDALGRMHGVCSFGVYDFKIWKEI